MGARGPRFRQPKLFWIWLAGSAILAATLCFSPLWLRISNFGFLRDASARQVPQKKAWQVPTAPPDPVSPTDTANADSTADSSGHNSDDTGDSGNSDMAQDMLEDYFGEDLAQSMRSLESLGSPSLSG